ncbi:DUF763 domain-containing protein [Caldisericum exile]|uniref:DUF763 domain-containing protein n=1 Tax=Caldisericum exile (strain DSM 21853 / NBRC 104410 / AZM16c01) TaxID=511051 RepID=A0A7U6GE51_CALEA|nr:DUF763 domain-containing protein [Caldisericum exile]BAL80728.1 hypothetical protein CSE_06020 [Caldisericum exile AZM16c01]
MRQGYVELPLHGGNAPPWLFKRMEKLAKYLSIAIVDFFGIEEYLKRLSDPIWFQSFGCLLGFDWHSSGLTTTTTGAIISGLSDESKNLGLFFAGGKGARAIDTPNHINRILEQGLIDLELANSLKRTSRLVAKVDSSCIQDGYKLYHHFLVFDKFGNWTIIQQGMKESKHYARRYHWNSFGLKSLVNDPHKGIITAKFETPLNLVDSSIVETQKRMVQLASDKNFSKEIRNIKFPSHHPIYESDFDKERLSKIFSAVSELNPKDFEELLLVKGVGEKSLRALALSSHLIFGSSLSFKDPATFSFAHGGKDGYPYPVMRDIYDKTIEVFETAIKKAKLSELEKEKLLSKLKSLVV